MSKASHNPVFDHTFADEYGAPDLILTRSETRAVKLACQKLGLHLSTAPTGRTVQVVLQAALGYATAMRAGAKNPYAKQAWARAEWSARRALAQGGTDHIMDIHSN